MGQPCRAWSQVQLWPPHLTYCLLMCGGHSLASQCLHQQKRFHDNSTPLTGPGESNKVSQAESAVRSRGACEGSVTASGGPSRLPPAHAAPLSALRLCGSDVEHPPASFLVQGTPSCPSRPTGQVPGPHAVPGSPQGTGLTTLWVLKCLGSCPSS